MKKKLILANNRSRLVSLRNLRKGLFTFLYQAHREGIQLPTWPRAQTKRDVPRYLVEFLYVFGEKRSFFCVGVTDLIPRRK